MKTTLILLFGVFFMLGLTLMAQEQEPATEAGDDFDLYGAIGLFEDAEDIEDFEKKLNDEANDVNNLDLNADEEVDMVKIVELSEASTKVYVIRAVLGENDFQDIATIELEKFSDTEISCQVIGDEDIYGPDYIIEPSEETASLASYYPMAVFVSVHLWRPVRVIWSPGRAIFVSAVLWHPRPVWFRPRRPIARSAWRGRAARWHSPHVRHSSARHSSRGRSMYSSQHKKSNMASKNYHHKSNQQQKQQQPQQKQQQQKKQQQKKKR
ncbi:MAG: hypothetical protein KAI08_16160 [Bacteroidales bacterium]|nr:hypothetical protein [Bacteroidales bacterium]